MGHYRSEMGYEEQDSRAAQRAKERRVALVRKIDQEIKLRGVAEVLADIVLDPVAYKLQRI